MAITLKFYSNASVLDANYLNTTATIGDDGIMTAAALITYPGTAPDGQTLNYWMVSGKAKGLSDVEAVAGTNYSNYAVNKILQLYPTWKTVVTYKPTAISNVPTGNMVSPQSGSIRYGTSYLLDNSTGEMSLSGFDIENQYDIVITTQDMDENLPATMINFTSGVTGYIDITDVQTLGSTLISKVQTAQSTADAAVKKSGDTMTGALTATAINASNGGQIKTTNSGGGFAKLTPATVTLSTSSGASHTMDMSYRTGSNSTYELLLASNDTAGVYLVGLADPIADNGATSKSYVATQIANATTNIKAYIDAQIEEKIADAIGGAY